MKATTDIPRTALNVSTTSASFLPDVAIHRHGKLYRQESSHSHYWMAGSLLLIALIIAILPWGAASNGSESLKYWIAGGLAWGGLCSLLPVFIRKAYGQRITIDPANTTLSLTKNGATETIPWQKILGLQLCYQNEGKGSRANGYQLNLVWKRQGEIKRHCLYKHAAQSFVRRLANQYQSLLPLQLLDHTKETT